MTYPDPELGPDDVLARCVTVLRAELSDEIAAINARLALAGAAYTLTVPDDAEILQDEWPGHWPQSFPAIRLSRAQARDVGEGGSIGLTDLEVEFAAAVYCQTPHGRETVTAPYDPGELNSIAWKTAAAVREVIDRELCDGPSGVYHVVVGRGREVLPQQVGGDNLNYVKVIELAVTAHQRVRRAFGT